MFTGIVDDIGTIIAIEKAAPQTKESGGHDTRLRIASHYAPESLNIGASVSVAGICLTLTDKGDDAKQKDKYAADYGVDSNHWFAVEVSQASCAVTTARYWQPGTKLNLERALKLGDELGGHIVNGHVDGLAEIIGITDEGASQCFVFTAPEQFARFIAAKGSITLDGTSLTVNDVYINDANQCEFTVNMIAHTQAVTTWGLAKIGDKVNLEIDVLARYIARLTDDLKEQAGKPKECPNE